MTAGKYPCGGLCDAPEICPVAAACLPGSAAPCLEMDRFHNEKLRMCDDLEQIADSLPREIDRRLCLIVAAGLTPLLEHCHAYEEQLVFPAFAASSLPSLAGDASARRLKAEHVEDKCAAQDLADMLFAIGHGAPIGNPEALGFMLRAFFGAMRRHIAFEREHVMPVLARQMPG